jgi:hypothetical protein
MRRLAGAVVLAALAGCGQPSVRLGPEQPLSASLRSLEVTRVGRGGERLGAHFDPAVLSAKAMHERGLEPPDGEVHGRWVLGEPAWDAVGRTRQRSGGEPREGLWAHPRDGTELDIEADVELEGTALVGFFGFTDFSLAQARSAGVDAPVRFELDLDGARLLATEVARRAGWSSFHATVPDTASGTRHLRVSVDCDDDTWAHFVFDVWAAGERSSANEEGAS